MNKFLLSFTCVLLCSFLMAQKKTITKVKIDTLFRPPTTAPLSPADSAARRLDILHAGRYNYRKVDSANEFLSLAIEVRLRQAKTLFDCDSVVLNQITKIMEAFGNVHINDADSIHTYAQYLKYYSLEKKAILKRNVRLTDGKGVLTTEDLNYDLNTKIGTYTNGGKVVNGKTVLTSKEGTYYGETKDVIFRKNVNLVSPEYQMATDSLNYNTSTEIATFVTKTTIVQGKRKIFTESGFYNMRTGEAFFGKRSIVRDSGSVVIAEDIRFDKVNDQVQATGNVIYADSINNVTIFAGDLKSNNKTKSFLATIKPLMIMKQDKDSIYITADTLFSGQLSDRKNSRTIVMLKDTVKNRKALTQDSSTNRFFEGYHNVRIFSDSVQAAGDSMFYSFKDSVFRLFNEPIVWGNGSQLTGDTIYMFTENKKPKRLQVFENAMAVNKVDKDFYNQVKGNTINAYFKNGNIDNLRAKTNAESIYFAQDENKKYVGVNKSTSDVIDMYFVNKEANKIVFRNNLKGTTYPLRQISPEQMKLRNFKWQENRRPKTKFEMFGSITSKEEVKPLPATIQ
jgi:lipopolysaccharide export system protein LptA